MKTLGKLSVEAILTFEEGPQVFLNTQVFVPTVGLNVQDLTNLEVDVVEQILTHAIETDELRLDDLVKLSLCYTAPPSAELGLQHAFRFLIRGEAKYYFQPDQADFVESAIMQRMLVVACNTKEQAA